MKAIKKYGVEMIMVLALVSSIMNHNRKDSGDQNVMTADALGYYAYLPAVFIYHDPTFSFKEYYEKTYYGPTFNTEFRNKIDGHFLDKYFSGIALLQIPFFLTAHAIALIFNLPADGYSGIYNWALIFCALFYLYLGLKALFRLLTYFLNEPITILFILLVLFFGTNLFHYTAREPAMSHVYSFSMSCIFALSLYRLCFSPSRKQLFIAFVSFGLIVAIRPVNVLMIGLFPIIAGSWARMRFALEYILKNLKYFLAFTFLALLPLIIQSFLWFWQTGHYIVYSYGTEKFNWGHPHFFDILFSFNKGWFIYTPIACIGIMAFVLSWKEQKFRAIVSLCFIVLVTYVLSSWWNWYYGYGFGQRAFIDFLIVPVLGLVFLFHLFRQKMMRVIFIFIGFGAIALNQIQDFQYRHYILRWVFMDEKAYCKVFLRTSEKYNGVVWDNPDSLRRKDVNGIRMAYDNNFEDSQNGTGGNIIPVSFAKSGNLVAEINNENHQSPVIRHVIKSCDTALQASVWFYGDKPINSVFEIRLLDSGKVIFNKSVRLLSFSEKNNAWTEAALKCHFPKNLPQNLVFEMDVSNSGTTEELFLDDFQANVFSQCK